MQLNANRHMGLITNNPLLDRDRKGPYRSENGGLHAVRGALSSFRKRTLWPSETGHARLLPGPYLVLRQIRTENLRSLQFYYGPREGLIAR